MTPAAGSNRSPDPRLAGVLLVSLLGLAWGALAQPNPDMIESDREFLSEPDDSWKESPDIQFPAAPLDKNLIRLDSESIGGRFDYYIDPTALSLGSDGVLRFTMVLESSTGVRNIFYEGIRCASSEFRTYAYATRSGEFRPLATKPWQKLSTTPPYDYHRLLAERYICHRNGWTLDEKQVRQRITQDDPARKRTRPRPSYYDNFGN